MKIFPHTIFLMIGASNCGKTHYCKNVLIPQLEQLAVPINRKKLNISYISSDDIRRELLNDTEMDKYHPAMLSSSNIAFDILYKKVELVTSFPINSEFVIVDTKGTYEPFREYIYNIALKNRYNVVPVIFNYKSFDDYKTEDGYIREHIKNDILKTRKSLIGIKKIPVVRDTIIIKNKDFDSLPKLEIENHNEYINCIVTNAQNYLIISDIHGCYDEFISLLNKNGIIVDNTTHKIVQNDYNKKIIIAGDYIDNGNQIFDMIDFCYQNLNDIRIIIGNHENRLYKELKENLVHLDEPWFNTFNLIKDSEEYKEKFIKIFEQSVPFIMNDYFIVTHAPCSVEYLGKFDNKSKSYQRYYKHDTDKEVSLYEELNKIHLFDKDLSHMSYIFGHIPADNAGKGIKGRYLIDGGCVLGRKLISLEVDSHGKIYTKSVQSSYPYNKEPDIPVKTWKAPIEEVVTTDNLTWQEQLRLKHMADNKINFLSGTMSPCDKFNNELESIESAINYFKQNKVFDIVIQKKYMGSRMNMYLTNDNSTSHCISRKGYPIRLSEEQLSPLYDKFRNKLSKFYDWNKIDCIILDGELMPWMAVSEGLIKDFQIVYDNLKIENQFLKDNSFESNLNVLKSKLNQSNFSSDVNKLNKKEMSNLYGNTLYESFREISDFNYYVGLEERESLIEVYREQMVLYGSPGEIDYKAFAILKVVYKDGKEECYYLNNDEENPKTNQIMFDMVNEDKCHRYDLNNEEDIESCIEQFKQYTAVEHCEGIVMKPNDINLNHVVPYMKVRNPDYLTIIYGYDYRTEYKFQKLYNKKSIHNKLRTSKKEWQLGKELLAVPYKEINRNNEYLKLLYTSFIKEENNELGLDPRL